MAKHTNEEMHARAAAAELAATFMKNSPSSGSAEQDRADFLQVAADIYAWIKGAPYEREAGFAVSLAVNFMSRSPRTEDAAQDRADLKKILGEVYEWITGEPNEQI